MIFFCLNGDLGMGGDLSGAVQIVWVGIRIVIGGGDGGLAVVTALARGRWVCWGDWRRPGGGGGIKRSVKENAPQLVLGGVGLLIQVGPGQARWALFRFGAHGRGQD